MKHVMLYEEFAYHLDEMNLQMKKTADKLMKEIDDELRDKSRLAELKGFINFQIMDPYLSVKDLIDRIMIRFQDDKGFMTPKVKHILKKFA